MQNRLKLALLFGGPSPERAISLNSARSVCDHLDGDDIELIPIYFDIRARPHLIERAQLYSNTPSDFDFKLGMAAQSLSEGEFSALLKDVDLAFPVIHGSYGEDGTIQGILEQNQCPYVGSSQDACRACFDKYEASLRIGREGFCVMPSIVIDPGETDYIDKVDKFFRDHIRNGAIVKPAKGGSSIGVSIAENAGAACAAIHELLYPMDGSPRVFHRFVVEPFCQGTEFTLVLLQNRFGLPVALIPAEIELKEKQLFDYRTKYLATNQSAYHCPPRFQPAQIELIQTQAEQLFALFGMRDFARFDGWVLPDGRIWFSDFNPISGMEQNSFLFLQAARIGMSHRDVLRFIIENACRRSGLAFQFSRQDSSQRTEIKKRRVHVLFGGATERQVSVLSGTNVWLKLRQSEKYEPHPYLLDLKGNVWELPYAAALYHTVEEITHVCKRRLVVDRLEDILRQRVLIKLNATPEQINEPATRPIRMSWKEFVRRSDFIFIALHGGAGENGTVQKYLQANGVAFNGSDENASRLCMDKFRTGQVVKRLTHQGISTARKLQVSLHTPMLPWDQLTHYLNSDSVIVKPVSDGCSAGVARLYSANDLATYQRCIEERIERIPKGTLQAQDAIIEMPKRKPTRLLFEEYIETDRVCVRDYRTDPSQSIDGEISRVAEIDWSPQTGWIEVTVGLIGPSGAMKAMNPSLTIAQQGILSLEEKFMGGTGINITPPPDNHVRSDVITAAKRRIESVARELGLSGYARIDAFMKVETGEIIVIEANTLPGLSPSTVIFHQALVEPNPMYPRQFLERILDLC